MANYGVMYGVSGPSAVGDGANTALRTGRTGAICTQDAHGRFQEAVFRGNVWSAQTAGTGVDHGSSISTTAAFSLHNPLGSGKRLSIIRVSMGYVSGTLGAGAVLYLANGSNDARPTGTAIVPVNLKTFADAGSAALPFTTATITAPTPIGVFCNLQPSLATTAVAPWTVMDYPEGLIQVAPGCTLSLHGLAGAAGTSPLVIFNVVWEEIAE